MDYLLQFCENYENTREFNPYNCNCPRALAITSTYRTVISHVINFQCETGTLEVCTEFLQNAPSNSVLSSSPFICAAVSNAS